MKISLVLLLLAAISSAAQSSSSTELYGPVPAAQVYDSLGTNISPNAAWEYQAAQAAHMTWGRFDCSWQNVEIQLLPQNTSGGYTLPKPCAQGLANGKAYGVHSILNALYGAPYNKVATATLASPASRGATAVQLQLTSGSLASIVPGQSYLKVGSRDISAKHAYAGTLIAAISENAVTLASALTTDLPAGTSVVLNLQLYPPVLVAPNTNFLNNPSIRAYENYVHFLQTAVAASGFPGRVSIWNEPPWLGDPWDSAANLYDSPSPQTRLSGTFGVELAYAALSLPLVPNAPLDNGYTNKTGSGSVLLPTRTLPFAMPNLAGQTFASESFHPYGNNPEDDAWDPVCVQNHNSPATFGHVFKDCTPVGMNASGNTKMQAAFSAQRNGNPGVGLAITETGLGRGGKSPPTETQITRFDLRQFLIFAGLGVRPILFYRLANDHQLAWFQSQGSPYPVYTAFQGLMADIGSIAHSPVAQSPTPTVTSYAGTYPLASVVLVGSHPGDRANSVLFYTWQRSYSPASWNSLPSPPPASVTVAIPGGLKVAIVKNTVSSAPVLYKMNGRMLTYPVTDDPIEVLLTP